jgi:hypothetical protein
VRLGNYKKDAPQQLTTKCGARSAIVNMYVKGADMPEPYAGGTTRGDMIFYLFFNQLSRTFFCDRAINSSQ